MHLTASQITAVAAIVLLVVTVILLRYNPLDKNGRSPMTKWKRVRLAVYLVTAVTAAVAIVWNFIAFYL